MLFWKLLAKLNLRLLMMYLQRKQLRKNSTLTSIMKMLLSFNITLKLIYMNLQLMIMLKQDLNVLHFLRLKCKMAVYLLGNWKCYTDEKLFLLLNRTCAMQSQHWARIDNFEDGMDALRYNAIVNVVNIVN